MATAGIELTSFEYSLNNKPLNSCCGAEAALIVETIDRKDMKPEGIIQVKQRKVTWNDNISVKEDSNGSPFDQNKDNPLTSCDKKPKRRWLKVPSISFLNKPKNHSPTEIMKRRAEQVYVDDEPDFSNYFLPSDDDSSSLSNDSLYEEEEEKENNKRQVDSPSGEIYTNPSFSCDSCAKLLRRFGGKVSLANAVDIKLVESGRGKCLVTDTLRSRILQFDKYGKFMSSYFIENMLEPWALDVNDSDTVYVSSRKHGSVFQFHKNGEVETKFGHTKIITPAGIVSDKKGRIFVSDTQLNQVFVFDKKGKFLHNLCDPVSGVQEFKCPRYLAVTPTNDILVSDSGNHCFKVFDSKGKFIRRVGHLGRRDGELKYPYGICSHSSGKVLVADHYNNRVSMFSKEGLFIRHLVTADDGLKYPQGIALSSDHQLYVTHGGLKAKEIVVYDLKKVFEGEGIWTSVNLE